MAEPIQFRRTVNPAPASISSADGTTVGRLRDGEPAVAIAPGNVTKLWLGDGTGNRLLLSTDLTANPLPLFTAGYLKLTGGTVSGAIEYTGAPAAGAAGAHQLVNRDYVDQAVVSGQQRQGAYDAFNNVPALNPPVPTPTNGQYWEVNVAGNAITGIPGITPATPLNIGSKLVWNTTIPGFELIPGGGMTQGEGDARFVQLGGSTMTGALVLNGAPGAGETNRAANKGYVDTELGNYVPLSGGSLAGPGNLSMTGTLSVTGTSTLTGNVTAAAGLVIGNPTGGNQGAGSVNAQSIYLDGVAMTLGVDGGTFA